MQLVDYKIYRPKATDLTLEDILNTADITNTNVDMIIKIAIREAKKNHIKRDISNLLPDDNQAGE